MIAAGVTKDFGVLASDSASYVSDEGEMSFESPKLVSIGKYLLTFIGTPLYFSRIDRSRFGVKLNELSLYLQDYLKGIRRDVDDLLKQSITDPDENQPNFCLYVLGVHGNYPTLAQFNSFNDFKPKYLWSDNGLKFSSVLYGDDSKPEKQAMFKETTKFMEEEAKRIGTVTPGVVGEILTRGIYKKADLEMNIGTKKKYAGGMVNAAVIRNDGTLAPLSGIEIVPPEVINGRR